MPRANPINTGYLFYHPSLAFWRKCSCLHSLSLSLLPSSLFPSLTFPLSLSLPISPHLPTALPFVDPFHRNEMLEMFKINPFIFLCQSHH